MLTFNEANIYSGRHSSLKRNGGGPWSKNDKPVIYARDTEHANELKKKLGRRALIKLRSE